MLSFERSKSNHSRSMSNSIAKLSRLTSYSSMLCSAYCCVHWPDGWTTQIPSPMKSIHEEYPWRSIDCSDRESGGHDENVGINDRRYKWSCPADKTTCNLVMPPIRAPGTKPGRAEDEGQTWRIAKVCTICVGDAHTPSSTVNTA